MGFRSTMISQNYCIKWPEWLKNKWPDWVKDNSVISISKEVKSHITEEVIEDLNKALNEINWFKNELSFDLVNLHECGGITKIQINKEEIYYAYPIEWNKGTSCQSDHYYCYGCSDIRKIDKI